MLIVYTGTVTGGAPRALAETTEVKLVAPAAIDFDELAFDTTRAAMRDWQERVNGVVKIAPLTRGLGGS